MVCRETSAGSLGPRFPIGEETTAIRLCRYPKIMVSRAGFRRTQSVTLTAMKFLSCLVSSIASSLLLAAGFVSAAERLDPLSVFTGGPTAADDGDLSAACTTVPCQFQGSAVRPPAERLGARERAVAVRFGGLATA